MEKLIKHVKKLSPKKGDFLVIKTKIEVSDDQRVRFRKFMSKYGKGVIILWVEDTDVYAQKSKQGKHKVYLNNLEYLEYMDKKRGNL